MVEAAQTKEQIRDELIAFSNEHINNWDNLENEFASNELGFDFVSRQTYYEGNILTVSKAAMVPGLTTDKHAQYRENLTTEAVKLDDRV